MIQISLFFRLAPTFKTSMKGSHTGASVGLWRSLVARPSGGRKVAGSSPASPTINKTARITSVLGGLVHKGADNV